MKKLFLYLFAIMAFWACSKSEEVTPEITLKMSSANFAEDWGSTIIYFTSTDAWTAEVVNHNDNKWCNVKPSSGNAGSTNIVISAEANNSIENRTATVVLKSGTVEKTISVQQDKKSVISFPNSEYTIEGKGGTIEVDVSHNIDFDVTIDRDWITQKQSRALDIDKLTFVVAENETINYRTGSITLKSKDGKTSQQISVKQEGGIFEIHYTSLDGQIVSPSPNSYWGGAKIVSNVYENGKGIILFDGLITTIGASSFSNCITLKSIKIPDSVTSIEWSAFSDCSLLTSIDIPDSVVSIEGRTFDNCTNLKSINIPNSLIKIGEMAFRSCESLKSINIPEGVTSIGHGTFVYCYSLENINIPKGITKIEDSVFSNCYALTHIDIPDSILAIGEGAFWRCESLTKINIPNSVILIEESAFADCNLLKSVYCKPTTPPSLSTQVFDYNASERKIYVPSSSVEAYKIADGWKEYAEYIEGYEFE